MTMDATLVRTAMNATAPGARHPTMPGTHAHDRCAPSAAPHRTGARTADQPFYQGSMGAHAS